MPRHHHANLGVTPGGIADIHRFLVDLLGYRAVDVSLETATFGGALYWFEAEDGTQIHLSEDADHRPAERAHLAIEFDADDLAVVERRLSEAGVSFKAGSPGPGFPRVVFLRDPSGNRWELRGPLSAV